MKKNDKINKLAAIAIIMAVGLPSTVVRAEYDSLLADTDTVLNSTTINIDGDFNAPPRESRARKLEKMRKQLEKKNEEMVSKKIEDMRIDAETKLTKKLYKAFNGGLAPRDHVSVGHAAPIRKEIIKHKIRKKIKNRDKAIVSLGMNTMDGDGVSVSDSLRVGVGFESMLRPRVSIGVGVSLSSMSAVDTAESGYYYEGREVDYKRLSLEVNSKFYLTVGSMIKPYIGGGLAYNRTSVEYNQNVDNGFNNNSNNYYSNNNYYNNSYNTSNNSNAQDSSLSSSNISAVALLGAEVGISGNFAMSVDFKYNKDLSSGTEAGNNSIYSLSDEDKLKNITANIEDADQLSINAGIIFKF